MAYSAKRSRSVSKSDYGGKADMTHGTLDSFFRSWPSEGSPLAVFQVYSDESGKLADCHCVVFGSVVFANDEARPFCSRWNSLLPSDVKYVSMKDAMHSENQFRGWKGRKRDRDDLLESLANLFYERCTYLVKSPMTADDFRRLPKGQRRKLRDIPYAAFEALIKGISDMASTLGPRDQFHLVYDLSDEYSQACLKLFNRLRSMHGKYKDTFVSLSFADDAAFPPLQAADILAYCERSRITDGDAREPILKRIEEILYRGKSRSRDLVYRDESGLGDGSIEFPVQ